jgi:magnesium chelatase family protein
MGPDRVLVGPVFAKAEHPPCRHATAGPTPHGRAAGRGAGVIRRPVCALHHPLSDVGLIGGGRLPTPGEVSLAHHGVRLLDELLECRRHVLDV